MPSVGNATYKASQITMDKIESIKYMFMDLMFAVIFLSAFFLMYVTNKDNKDYCVQSGGSVVVQKHNFFVDDWVCNK